MIFCRYCGTIVSVSVHIGMALECGKCNSSAGLAEHPGADPYTELDPKTSKKNVIMRTVTKEYMEEEQKIYKEATTLFGPTGLKYLRLGLEPIDEEVNLHSQFDEEREEEESKLEADGKITKTTKKVLYAKTITKPKDIEKPNLKQREYLALQKLKYKYATPNMGKDSASLKLIKRSFANKEEYLRKSQVRAAALIPKGRIRRNSIGWGIDVDPATDISDVRRESLGKILAPDGGATWSPVHVVKTAVLSIHGANDVSMCNGYGNNRESTRRNDIFEKAMNNEYEPKAMDILDWMQATLKGRAQPDVIVLLEGKTIADKPLNNILINGFSYTKVAKFEVGLKKRDSKQNITAWSLDTTNKYQPNVSLVDIPIDKGDTRMAVIKHTVGEKFYYEYVCHLPNDHASDHAWDGAKKWLNDNKKHFESTQGADKGIVLNVMGDTNFKMDYEIWSPSFTHGGDLKQLYNTAFTCSSEKDSKFMRQMVDEALTWADIPLRIQRASYLNHVQVRNGTGLCHKWGTDHPSFMSFTTIYEKSKI